MASLYKRGSVWWVQYYRPSSRRAIRASLRTTDEATARRELKKLEGRLASGNYTDVRVNKIRFGHLLDLVETDYSNSGRKSAAQLKCRITLHIRPSFGDRRATSINAADITLYVAQRRETASNGTINRELDVIKKAFRLGGEAYGIPCPPIHKLRESNARQGFLDRPQVDAICRQLPDHYAAVVRFGFLTGWRISEIRSLEWRNVDFDAGEIRLDTSKNEEGRVIKMTGELRGLLDAVLAANKAKTNTGNMSAPMIGTKTMAAITHLVFNRRLKKSSKLLAIGDFGKLWDKACIDAGVGKRHFHDLRRSAVRVFVRAGIPERVAMQITGHKTRDVFERYNIVSSGDLDDAAKKLDGIVDTKADTKAAK